MKFTNDSAQNIRKSECCANPNFFRVALWSPLLVMLALTLVEQGDEYAAVLDWQQMLLIYVLSFGIPAYIAFALWAMRALNGKTEQQILKSVWRAPLTFIPFYAVPWVIYGLAHVLLGSLAGFPMMLGWLAFLPYLLIAGYVVSGLTVALYRTVFS
ncbi:MULTISPECIES: hypothetical protein [Pseudomonas]|nr:MULTISPECIES: hypothetical protein [Pseudomonas]OOL37372.1 hypothetical protein BOO94_13705 [Pseudomonas sp. FSL W5-0299]